jgi:hypothetical protein
MKLTAGNDLRSVAGAFAGEIGAFLDIVRRRRYLDLLNATLDDIAAGKPPSIEAITAGQNYFRVYDANAERLGVLPGNLATDVARFYTLAFSIVEDATNESLFRDDPTWMGQFLTELRDLLTQLVILGSDLCRRLREA